MNETQLIKRCQQGDMKAFRALYDMHHQRVLSLCWRLSGDRHAAEDLCQDTFIKVYRNIDNFRFQSGFATWLHRIALNLSLNYCRKHRRQNLLKETPCSPSDFEHVEEPDTLNPQDMLIAKEQQALLWDAINSLPLEQRTVFVLQKIEGYAVKEIADMLECTASSVESRLHRAKKQLSKKLTKKLKKNRMI